MLLKFDCHAHVYEKVASIPDARYVPSSPAPLAKWLSHHEQHNIKGGVIVQVSFLGTDNSELCAALAKLDRAHFAGVAVVPLGVSDDALAELVRSGVRGVRWNLVHGKEVPDLTAKGVQAFFCKLRRHNLHLEIHLEGPRLAPILSSLTDQGVRVVVDHFGLPSDPHPNHDPMVRATKSLTDATSLYFKFSAPYRSPFNVMGHAHALLSELSSDHFVWGSDWPHTQHENEVDFASSLLSSENWGLVTDIPAACSLYGIDLEG